MVETIMELIKTRFTPKHPLPIILCPTCPCSTGKPCPHKAATEKIVDILLDVHDC